MSTVLTVLEALVAADREPDLLAAYRSAATDQLPPGLMRSQLLRVASDPGRWQIATWWESRAALDAMRAQGGTPRGILIFRAAGAEPALRFLEVADELGPNSAA